MNKLRQLTFTDILLPVLLVLVGGFHEYIACAASVAMCVYLFLRLRRGGELLVRKDLTALAVGAVCLGYGLSCLWAVDPGMALLGFVKFLPVGLYALCMWQEQGKGKLLEILPAFGAVLAVLSLYLGTAAGLSHFRQYGAAEALYPFHTQNKLAMLEQETDVKKAYELALEILEQNDTCYVPHSIRAKYAYSQGDFASLIESKNNVFRLNPFGYEEYEEYCVMLINGILLYEQDGDTQSVKICQMQLQETQVLLESNADRLSALGKLIKDQPITQLSQDVRYYIEQMG